MKSYDKVPVFVSGGTYDDFSDVTRVSFQAGKIVEGESWGSKFVTSLPCLYKDDKVALFCFEIINYTQARVSPDTRAFILTGARAYAGAWTGA